MSERLQLMADCKRNSEDFVWININPRAKAAILLNGKVSDVPLIILLI